ncbi:UNVERIFIED_CONTAM: Retrovirus-related Pol polyprotein from transposon TNT 1-94 [Sesamum latifolium]|uniref:Retrovirus-related Pol polyprotein from transposon TNT 1-94 n=1 Tax=Sesamum latifolium TaxID=2727402 RepID=A0AAW2U1T6_9LAMI
MILASVPLNKRNWISWSRYVQIGLGVKSKIGFIDGSYVKSKDKEEEHDQWIKADYLVRTEVMRLMGRNMEVDPVHVNYTKLDEFVGNGSSNPFLSKLCSGSWVVSTGATDHMCVDMNIFKSVVNLSFPLNILLPDGTKQKDLKCKVVLAIGSMLPHSSPPSPDLLPHLSSPHRSHRQPRPPAWMADFISQACTKDAWKQAMKEELDALHRNGTWELADLPSGKKVIGCKWVYKVKVNPDGTVSCCKAHLVAKRYNQLLLLLGSFINLIKNMFLHGYLDEDIYMSVPEGCEAQSGQVCKLKRSLYELKQASRQWNQEFTHRLLDFGFLQSHHDHCLFTNGHGSTLLILVIYLDDVLICGPSIELIRRVKQHLDYLFTIKDIGDAKYFLGLEIARFDLGIAVTQNKYILDIVHDAGLDHACLPILLCRHVLSSLLIVTPLFLILNFIGVWLGAPLSGIY